MIKVNLNLYGAFRQIGVSKITLEVQDVATVEDLRKSLERYIQNSEIKISDQLVKVSAFATDESVLKDTDKVINNMSLAIFPPICGG